MIQTEEARNDENMIWTDIELLEDMSSPDLLSNTLDCLLIVSSIVNTVNLFTGDWGTLIAGCVTQNPPLPEDKTPLIELYLPMPTDL